MANLKHYVRNLCLIQKLDSLSVTCLNVLMVQLNPIVHILQVTGVGRFERLSVNAKLVLVLSHSIADAEQVFYVVRLNKTKTRNSLPLEGTLTSNDN